jgi:hypothetical protein
MAVKRSRLTNSQEESVAAICEIGPSKLKQIFSRLETHDLIISVEEIRSLIIDNVGADLGEHLATFLFGVAVAHRRDEASPATTLQSISELVKKSPKVPNIDVWEACQPIVESLLNSRSLRAATKALSVAYDFERLYLDGRFLTSMRPIFDPPREEIIGAVVVQTLRLEYTSTDGGRSTISLALDKADLEQLKTSCERALKKAQTLKRSTTKWALPTFSPGEKK